MTASRAEGHGAVTSRLLTVPNVLSLLRLGSVPVFLWLFLSGAERAAVVLYAAGAVSDFFDGFIARRWRQVSDFGRLLDPLSDRVFIVALTVALVAREAFPWPLAVGIVVRDVVLLSLWPLFERRHVGRIAVNFTGKTATALLLVGLTLMAVGETGWPWADRLHGIGLGFAVIGGILYWVAGAMYAREALRKLRGSRTQA